MHTNFINYISCPICHSATIHRVLAAKDYTVSQKEFEIWECSTCTFRFTQNAPDAVAINAYYQSENYISHSNTNKGLVNQLYHAVRKQTLTRKRRLVNARSANNGNSGSLLDIGAGTGAFVQHMEQHGWKATGLEPDETARQRALEAHQVKLLPIEELNIIPAESFDAITMWHVLEHVHALHDCIRQIKKIIKPTGYIFIAVPNYTSYDAGLYKSYWAAYDVPRHLYHFSPASMEQLLENHGLTLHGIKPMWFDSFYISMLSEQYKTGHSNIVKAFFNGAVSNLKAVFNKEYCSSLIYVIGK
ncbi:MAG: class I SAM-dependent methyltransferase [Bacteroidetes bacterium]|nr:class I SAM-dependent methyltransferase [Bacteroidota bacterium]